MDIGQHCSVDDNVWNNTKLLRLGIEMAHGNEFAACFQGISKPSNSLQSYESSLIEGEVLQDDPSDYASGITRDVCFDDGRATIRVKNGRAWGLYRDFVAEAEGLGIAGEFSGFNNGSNQPLLDRTDSTYNVLITSKGDRPITAAIYLLPSRPGCPGRRVSVWWNIPGAVQGRNQRSGIRRRSQRKSDLREWPPGCRP